jgi:hypothetical protein
MGNVLHLIVGPETEYFVDIHGAKILDITELLNVMDEDARVFVSLTRCKNEGNTEALLKASKAPYLSSFTVVGCGDPACPNCTDNEEEKTDVPVAKAKKAQKKPVKRERCYYCHEDKKLLPIPGFKICIACAQIELGLKKMGRKNKTEGKDEQP